LLRANGCRSIILNSPPFVTSLNHTIKIRCTCASFHMITGLSWMVFRIIFACEDMCEMVGILCASQCHFSDTLKCWYVLDFHNFISWTTYIYEINSFSAGGLSARHTKYILICVILDVQSLTVFFLHRRTGTLELPETEDFNLQPGRL
jgi:hypothetical protein